MAANDVKGMFLSTLLPQVEAANALATKIQAASGDQGTLVHDIRNAPDTTDETVKKWQEFFEKAEAQIEANRKKVDEYILANLMPFKDESFDVEAAKAEHADLRKNINAGKAYAKGIGVTDEDLADLPDVKNLRGGTSSGGSGSSANGDGPKRPRVSKITVNGESVSAPKKNDDGTVTDVVSFTVLATYLSKAAGTKVEAGLIRDAIFSAAATTDLSEVKGRDFTVTETINGKSFEVNVVV